MTRFEEGVEHIRNAFRLTPLIRFFYTLWAENRHDVFRKSLAFLWFAFNLQYAGGGQKQFPNSKRTPCRMRPVA